MGRGPAAIIPDDNQQQRRLGATTNLLEPWLRNSGAKAGYVEAGVGATRNSHESSRDLSYLSSLKHTDQQRSGVVEHRPRDRSLSLLVSFA